MYLTRTALAAFAAFARDSEGFLIGIGLDAAFGLRLPRGARGLRTLPFNL